MAEDRAQRPPSTIAGLTVSEVGELFQVIDVSRSSDPDRTTVVTTNGRVFEFPSCAILALPLPDEFLLNIVRNVGERGIAQTLCIVELEKQGKSYLIHPMFPVGGPDVPRRDMEQLNLVDCTGGQRTLTMGCSLV